MCTHHSSLQLSRIHYIQIEDHQLSTIGALKPARWGMLILDSQKNMNKQKTLNIRVSLVFWYIWRFKLYTNKAWNRDMKNRDSACLSMLVIFLVFQFYLWPMLRMSISHSTKISQGMRYKILLCSLRLFFKNDFVFPFIDRIGLKFINFNTLT